MAALTRVLLTSAVLATALVSRTCAAPVLTEINYRPPGGQTPAEWFELHNPGATALDLTGWHVSRGVSYAFPAGTVLPPGGYLVVAANPATFTALHPAVTNVTGGWAGTLDDDGETIEITDAGGAAVESVRYSNEGEWAVRRLGAPDRFGLSGWEWFAPHKTGGHTLERVSLTLPAHAGQNWDSSTAPGGTPGAPNSIRATDAAPILTEPRHLPALPNPGQPVTLLVQALDESTQGLAVTLHWRAGSSLPFETVAMRDDGAVGDGAAKDGLFGAVIPGHPAGTLVEFHFTAVDAAGNHRTLPRFEPTTAKRSPYFVFQVDATPHAGTEPIYRMVVAEDERVFLENQVWRVSPLSDAEVNGTFVAIDGRPSGDGSPQVRYLASFRNRGHGTRYSWPHNFRVNLPKDRPWRDRTGLNLNSQGTVSQVLGSAVFRAVGVPAAESVRVQLRWNGVNLANAGAPQWGAYAANEVIDSDLAARMSPQDPDGNLYQGVRDWNPGIAATLTWYGPNRDAYTNAYFKENHVLADDWTDLIHLLDVLNNTPAETYPAAVRSTLDVDEWLRFFAANALLDNQENSLGIGVGDDYVLYFPKTSGLAQAWAYDMDSLLGDGTRSTATTAGIFRGAGLPAMSRFLKHPEFARRYHAQLQALAYGFFDPTRFDAFLDASALQLRDMPDLEAVIGKIKAHNASRVAFVRTQSHRTLAVTNLPPPIGNYPHTNGSTLPLAGTAPAALTASVRVRGLPAVYSAWEGLWTVADLPLAPGINHIPIEALDEAGNPVTNIVVTVWSETGTPQEHSGTVATDSIWTAESGPHRVTGPLTIAPGATLRIAPGASVQLGSGVTLTVADGGRLLAEGTAEAPISFGRNPASPSRWGGITILGSSGSPETRIVHAQFEGNGSVALHSDGGTVFLDSLGFATTDRPYVSLDRSSFVVSRCHFPATTAGFEPLHGGGGIKAGGHGVLVDCFVGAPMGYNDSFDFTGGNRPGQPLLHVLGNVFAGSGDDGLDLDGTDAWIEGNIFIGIHRNGAPDSAAAISGGSGGGATSEITIINNLFFDNDHAATAKQGNFYTFLHNTIVRTTHTGGQDTASAVINLQDTSPSPTTFGRGAYFEGNIIVDAAALTRNPSPAFPVTFVNNLLPFPYDGPGADNRVLHPFLAHVPTVAEARFTDWQSAQVMRDWLRPAPGSPAEGSGILGRDLGGVHPYGIVVSGEPDGVTASTSATLRVGPLRTGNGIPTDGFPSGSGYTAYRWRLDGGIWSQETPVSQPIALSGLSPGTHRVDVSGRRDTGLYQDDPVLGPAAVISSSRTWVVDPAYVPPPATTPVRFSEVLASNRGVWTHAGASPDFVEIVHIGSEPIDLGGISVSDSASRLRKFTFAAGTVLQPGQRLVLVGDANTTAPGIHLGFGVRASGDDLYLTDSAARGGALLDQLAFGVQIQNLSISRGYDDNWTLSRPTPGAVNEPIPTADPIGLRINEWLATTTALAPSPDDFVELFNTAPMPVALAGLQLSDATMQPARFVFPPLSYIDARGHAAFVADGDPADGPDHLSFRLSADHGLIHLSDPRRGTLDVIAYGPQRTDASQGRSPDGTASFHSFPGTATPGWSNTVVTLADTDGDGLPDFWERDNGLNPMDPSDAAGDLDLDGASNLLEYLAGTHPLDPADVLGLELLEGTPTKLRFRIVAGRTYSLQGRDALGSGVWQTLLQVGAQAQPGIVTHEIDFTGDQRFYRVVTPTP